MPELADSREIEFDRKSTLLKQSGRDAEVDVGVAQGGQTRAHPEQQERAYRKHTKPPGMYFQGSTPSRICTPARQIDGRCRPKRRPSALAHAAAERTAVSGEAIDLSKRNTSRQRNLSSRRRPGVRAGCLPSKEVTGCMRGHEWGSRGPRVLGSKDGGARLASARASGAALGLQA